MSVRAHATVARCMACLDEGFVETAAGVDACRTCVRRAEAAWLEREQQRRESMWEEHVNARGRGSEASMVALAAAGGKLVLVVGRGVLEQLPWYRGGQRVAVAVGTGLNAGRLRVTRGDTHRLLSRVAPGPQLEKLPPVWLRMDAFAHMTPVQEHEPSGCAHLVRPGLLEVTLPGWAAPPVPATAPAAAYHSTFLPVERRAAEGVR